LATVQDQVTFERETSIACNEYQEAIRQARSTYDAAHQRRLRMWRERVAVAKEAYDAVKSLSDCGPDFAAIKQEYEAASSTAPDLEGPRKRLGKDVAEADAALNAALAAAREKLATA
jgi:hypothetical protein